MNELQIFNYRQNEIRTVIVDGEPWWVSKDVCDALEIDTSQTRRLDEDEKGLRLIQTLGGSQEMLTINEPGLYSLILGSRKPEAKAFKRWITHEVIPSIRKHGMYAMDELLANPDLAIAALQSLKEEREKVKALEMKVESDKPKVLFADAVSASKASILIGELAKVLKQNGINIGQNRLFEKLRSDGFLIRRKGTDYNMPTQRSMELELFEIKETSVSHSDGHITVSKTTKVTGKGQLYFVNRFLTQGIDG